MGLLKVVGLKLDSSVTLQLMGTYELNASSCLSNVVSPMGKGREGRNKEPWKYSATLHS